MSRRLLRGRFLRRGRAGAAAVAVLVVAREQVLELVRRVQLVVELPLHVLDDRLVVAQAVLDVIELVVGDRAGERAGLLRRDEVAGRTRPCSGRRS